MLTSWWASASARGRTGPDARRDVPAMTGGRAGTTVRAAAGHGGERQGNGRERLGRSPGRCPRSVGRSAGRHVGPGRTALGNSAPAHWRSPLRRRRHRHLIVGARRPRSRCRRASCRCPDLHGHGRAAGWPVESAALSARPVVVVNVDGPGYEPSPVPAAGLADGAASHARPEEAGNAPMSSPRSARRRPEPASRTRGPARHRVTGDRRGGQPRVLAGAGAAREPVRWPAAGAAAVTIRVWSRSGSGGGG